MVSKLASGAMLLGGIWAAGCGTESVEADVLALSNGDTTSGQPSRWFKVVFQPDSSFVVAEQGYRLRINGKWAVYSSSDPEYVTVSPAVDEWLADNLNASPYTIELVDRAGAVLLTTSPLFLGEADRMSYLIIFGSRAELRYTFFANSHAETDSVPDGSVLARFVNVREDDGATNIYTCATAYPETNCSLAQGLTYGQTWETLLPTGTGLGELLQGVVMPFAAVGGMCRLVLGQDPVASKINIFPMAINGFVGLGYDVYEYGGVACEQ
jgi:hypothetical protein